MKQWIDRWRRREKKRRKTTEVKSFKEKQEQEKAFEYVCRGTQAVSLERIVGSVGRYRDFDGTFSLKTHLPRERLDGIRKAMR